MQPLKIKRLRADATLPQRATAGSAGLDLRACINEPVTLEPMAHAVIPTGLAIGLPDASHVGLVYARSGLAVKHGVTLINKVGVIDSDYTGEIHVGLINLFAEPYTIQPDERIAQLVVSPVCPLPVEETDTLEETQRGAGGFGSTGKQ